MLKAKGLDVIGLMIGDAITEADHNFKAELNALIKSLGIRNNIFMPGFRSDIPDLLAVSDCILIPSSEGLSLAALEAMSAKTRAFPLTAAVHLNYLTWLEVEHSLLRGQMMRRRRSLHPCGNRTMIRLRWDTGFVMAYRIRISGEI